MDEAAYVVSALGPGFAKEAHGFSLFGRPRLELAERVLVLSVLLAGADPL